MADIRCPNCGKDNPDFLDVCQFCQTPLTPESMVHIGEKPTKKNTGDLEPILPQWLKDVRQQGRDSAEEDAVQAATQSQVQKNEAPDLLAGLVSQSDDDEDNVPDWLASINPVTKPRPSTPSTPEPSNDFFAQFGKSEAAPATPQPKVEESAKEETPSWMGGQAQPQASAEKDELSAWLSSTSASSSEPFAFQPSAPQDDVDWMRKPGSSEPASKETPAPEEKEDLSWLHNLEASAKQTGDLSQPKQDEVWNFDAPSAPSQSAASQEDLSWLSNLGGTSEPAQPASSQPSQKDDLSWLNDLGGTSEPAQQPSAPASSQDDLSWLNDFAGTSETAQQPSAPASSQEDMSWLKTLGGTSEPAQQPSVPASSQDELGWLNNFAGTTEPAQQEPAQASASDDLGWLKNFAAPSESSQELPAQSQEPGWLDNLGGASEPSQSSTSQGDFDWLSNLGEISEPSVPAVVKPFGTTDELALPKNFEEEQGIPPHISPFMPRRTAPLSEGAADTMPDWLKSATEETPILPLGASALDHLRGPYQSPRKTSDEGTLPYTPEPASIESNVFPSSSESQSLSNQDVDSLFSVAMPDWLSQAQPDASDATSQGTPQPGVDDSLAPVELPSWVQAMRPVESVISETGMPSIENQPTEKEGPLAGLRGVIPSAPIGSSRRPKAFSLKLLATDEQQASAALLDQILAGETAPRAITSSSLFMSQRVLRWAITGLFMIVLGAIIAMRSQLMPISAALPLDVSAVSNAIATIPDNSSVLVVVDYEPSLAGEMEAVSGPLLDRIALARQSHLVFISTSPNSSALVERLMTNTKINKPAPDGLGYVAGEQYFNLGYLPGGSAGILGFVSNPGMVIPSAGVQSISEYAAVVVLTDNAESGRAWVEQLDAMKQVDPSLATHPLILVTSAQAGPLLQPYVSSHQVAGMINGLSDVARFEFVNNSRPGIARTYWDAFGIGIMMAVVLIIIGSAWSLMAGIRARRANGEQG